MKSLLALMVFSFSYLMAPSAHAEKKALDPASANELQLVLKQNNQLHAAFFTYQGKTVEKEAEQMVQVLNGLKSKFLIEKFSTVKKVVEKIKFTESELDKRKANNEYFHQFSKVLADLIKSYEVVGHYNVYYCPMVKMVWVQDSTMNDLVLNPYAPYMKNCGEKQTQF